MAQFTSAGGGGVPVTASISGATNPTVAYVSLVDAATEYSYTFPTGTRQFQIKLQALYKLQISYVSGDSGTTYITVPRGCFYQESDLNLTSSVTIYFQSGQASQMAEILYWT